MVLDDCSRAQVSWYNYSQTSLLPLNTLKPFRETYEVKVDTVMYFGFDKEEDLFTVLGPFDIQNNIYFLS